LSLDLLQSKEETSEMKRTMIILASAAVWLAPSIYASGHGPVFALATPTNPKGGFSFDTSFMGRYSGGSGTMFRATMGYGITENLKVSVSAPLVFQAEPFVSSRTTAVTPMGGDFEALGFWRLQRKDFAVGSRFETTAIGGLLVPGPQADMGPLKGMKRRPGGFAGIVSVVASRSHYAWVGTTYQRYAAWMATAAQACCFTALLTATGPKRGAKTTAGTGASLANARASEPASWNEAELRCQAAEATRSSSARPLWAYTKTVPSQRECSSPSTRT
jgi:hypothetical protein